jgi:hypothetical protein
MDKYAFVDVDDLPGEGPGGAVKKLRRALGAHAFGFNYFELPPGVEGREHDETESSQEEVMFVRLDPSAVRCPVAGTDGLTFVTFGSPVNERYEPPSWG